MGEQYQTLTEEQRQEFIRQIKERFDAYQQVFLSMKNSYRNSLEDLITSVEDKSYNLKIASMNQRSMILVLYNDYCDALYFHDFTECDQSNIPAMSDDFDTLLDKLISLEWDVLTNMGNLVPPPQKYKNVPVILQDDGEFRLPIQNFKNNR